ncbi:hypothetical protein N7532_005568 [Penicillium argentinense]|uniref:Uncharacterized protein n=1 Tax=Penicillium argentinense TaxID=1131581 RepID=A0A9W9KB09_9EURO|nr:uncharacterized protein N7532_005568 [Penicillium argentinense]KAJ5098567.1 hypothetical protein N7532_005568 [Penicillium argentinense]
MGHNKAVNLKVRVDIYKYSDQLHVYRLRRQDKTTTTRYIFHNVSMEDAIVGMRGFSTIIIASMTQFSRVLLFPNSAKAIKAEHGSTKVKTWPLSQALAQGALHKEDTEFELQPSLRSKDFQFVETIERENTSMDELVGMFTLQLYREPSVFKGTIYKMEWSPKLTLFFINLPATMEFMLFFLNRTDTTVNVHYGAPFDLAPRRLHAASLHVLQTKSLKDMRVDGRSKKRKHFPPATAVDTIEYTKQSFNKVFVTREIAVKVLRQCAAGEDSSSMRLTPAMASFVFSQILRPAQ